MTHRAPRQAEEELAVFTTFLAAHPSLAREVAGVSQPAVEFPDITLSLRGGEVDFELGEWLDGQQIQRAKKVERLEAAVLDAIGDQGSNRSDHFRFVMLKLREDADRFDPRDRDTLRTETFHLITSTDERWPSEHHWQSPQGRLCKEFQPYPILGKYLASAHFDPLRFGLNPGERWPRGHRWIVFELPGGAYSAEPALHALHAIIEKKLGHYGDFGRRPVRLLIFYGRAARYNTPYHDLEYRDFADVARAAGEWLTEARPPFEKIYLLNAAEPRPQAFEIYPAFSTCT